MMQNNDMHLPSEHLEYFHHLQAQFHRTDKAEWYRYKDIQYKACRTDDPYGCLASPYEDFRGNNGSQESFHIENQSIYRTNTPHSSKRRPQRVHKKKRNSMTRHQNFNMHNTPKEMTDFLAWGQENCEMETQIMKRLPTSRGVERSLCSSSEGKLVYSKY
jgi:hypothetical protein